MYISHGREEVKRFHVADVRPVEFGVLWQFKRGARRARIRTPVRSGHNNIEETAFFCMRRATENMF